MPDAPAETVGIVVVSHSRALADAAVALASEMLHGQQVRIAVAAGLDDTTFGTDAVAIKEAIEAVDGPAGVVVLMDLGSAVLSAELALEMLEDAAVRGRVLLSPASLVEGLVVAAVTAAGGAERRDVAAEAQDSLLAKSSQLAPPAATLVAETTGNDAVTGTFVVLNRHGLHARPAARLVTAMRGLDAVVLLRNRDNGRGPVPASSLSRVATLVALQGNTVEVAATGPDAAKALRSLLDLAERGFDERADSAEAEVDQLADGVADEDSHATGRPGLAGRVAAAHADPPKPAAPGIAVGPARYLELPPPPAEDREARDPQAEWRRLTDAVAAVGVDLDELRARTSRELGPDEAAVFEAHRLLLDDEKLQDDAQRRVHQGAAAEAAWRGAIDSLHAEWSALPAPYLQARAADVLAVGDQVLQRLTGNGGTTLRERGVLLARDLTPAETVQLDLALVQGIVLAHGAASSHAAILARARGIPAVVGAGERLLAVEPGTTVAIDGGTGEVVLDPAPDVVAAFERRRAEQTATRARDRAASAEPAVTRDGVTITVGANLGSVDDGQAAAAAGADDAGLVRTEFLFLGRDTAPSVDEQYEEYTAISRALGGRRITLRTLDVGGDKPLSYVAAPVEQNPFLGLRGLRLSLQRESLFREQLQAICRTAAEVEVDVMFPMVSQVGELLEALDRLRGAAGPNGLPATLRVGMMVEVPAAALNAAAFVPHLDFLSIGTNDLTQYALAAERGNPYVAGLSDVLDPGVLRLVDATCRAAEGRIPVAVCGEAAADPDAVPFLLGLGVTQLSVAPTAVPSVKARVRALDLADCRSLAQQALSARDSHDVRALVTD